MFNIKNKKSILIVLILFLTLLVLKLQVLDTPLFWDEIFWVKSVDWISDNNLYPILPGLLDQGGLDSGHPPLFLSSIAVAFILFGKSLMVAHLVMMIYAFLALYFTYLLGSYMYNKKIGIIATALLLFSPLFFAQSGMVNFDIPLAAFTVMTLYYALKNNKLGYLISGSLLVLSKEPGILTIIAILIYAFIKNYKEPKGFLLKKCIFYSLPLIPFILWVIFHLVQQLELDVTSTSRFWKPITFIIFFRFLNRIKYFFFDNFHWILTGTVLISSVVSKKVKKYLNIKKIIFLILTGFLIILLFTYGLKFLLTKTDVLTSLVSSNKSAFYISEKNLKEILLNLYEYRFIFSLFILIILIIKNNINFAFLKNKKLIPIFLTFLFYLILFSWTLNLPRYHLPLYPLFFILGAYSFNILFKKYVYLVSILMIVLFITQWNTNSTDTRGYLLEKNSDYLDSVETHKHGVEYIEKFFPDARVLTIPFMTDELRYPILGYIHTPMHPLDYTHYDTNNDYKVVPELQNDDWYYFSCYKNKQCNAEDFNLNKSDDIRYYDSRYDDYLTNDDFDLFYYSPQSPYPKDLENLINDFNLTLIKRFEKNGKYTELYATEKFLSEKPKLL